jgi:hypothetical protein
MSDSVENASLSSVHHQNPVDQPAVLPVPFTLRSDISFSQSSIPSQYSERDERSINVVDIVDLLNGVLTPHAYILKQEIENPYQYISLSIY